MGTDHGHDGMSVAPPTHRYLERPALPAILAHFHRSHRRLGAGALLAATATVAAALALPATGQAAVSTFGSSLSVPATLNTADNLNYTGTNAVQFGTGAVIHNNHDGADTALWNAHLTSGAPTAPADGQVTSVTLEGCAKPAAGGPAPLTQFHFQALTPAAGGGATVDVTTPPIDIPVCGVNGASGSTKSTYQPTNFCVHAGDYVDFNDEGGFVASSYPSGVPYEVIGSVTGATMNSFIGGDQTNNGATLSPNVTSPTSGFAINGNEELMLQATLATGPDATPLCPGGTAGVKPKPPAPGEPGGAPAVHIHTPQHDGVNHSRQVKVSLYCAQASPCAGTVALTTASSVAAGKHSHKKSKHGHRRKTRKHGHRSKTRKHPPRHARRGARRAQKAVTLAQAQFSTPGQHSGHVPMQLSAAAMRLIRSARHLSLPVTMTVTLQNGQTFSATITIFI